MSYQYGNSSNNYNNNGGATSGYYASRQSASVAPSIPTEVEEDPNPPKPDSYSYGVSAERHQEPVKEEVLYGEEDQWQPSFMMLCFIAWIVVVVAAGVAVGAYFGYKNRGKGTEGPTFAPSAFPTMTPSLVPPEMICNVCGDDDEDGVTEPLVVVNIPGLAALPDFSSDDVTCRVLEENGQAGQIPQDFCAEQVQQRSIQSECGCDLSPTAAPTVSAEPTNGEFSTPAPNFVCPICGGEDFGISNPTGSIQFPGTALTVTCQQLEERAQNGQIDPDTCFSGALTNAVQLNCDCIFQCSLCGTQQDGTNTGEITNPEGIVVLPLGQPERTCASLQEAAERGDISEQQCTVLQPFVVDPCECVFSNNVL